MNLRTTVSLFLLLAVAFAKTKDNGRPSCAVLYSVVQQDSLGNVQEGLADAKKVKWADKDLGKKYPDVCYDATDAELAVHQPKFEVVDSPPAPPVKVILWITVTPATYHGTRVVTRTQTRACSHYVNN